MTAGVAERDVYVRKADWFDTKKFPKAVFTSTKIHQTGEHAYSADGTLTIKGVARPTSLPFTLMQDGDHWRAQGKVTLLRSDFHIGEHDWASEAYVKYAVDVIVDLVAMPANKAELAPCVLFFLAASSIIISAAVSSIERRETSITGQPIRAKKRRASCTSACTCPDRHRMFLYFVAAVADGCAGLQ